MIQSTRFGANFSYEIDIDDACMEFIIPKLLLQPLLENSIKYGFQKNALHPYKGTGLAGGRMRSISR